MPLFDECCLRCPTLAALGAAAFLGVAFLAAAALGCTSRRGGREGVRYKTDWKH